MYDIMKKLLSDNVARNYNVTGVNRTGDNPTAVQKLAFEGTLMYKVVLG